MEARAQEGAVTHCAMCRAEKLVTADRLGTFCRHCDRPCAGCTVNPDTGHGRWCPLGERARNHVGIGPPNRW